MDKLKQTIQEHLEAGIDLLNTPNLTRVAIKSWLVELSLLIRELTAEMAAGEKLPGCNDIDLGF